MRRGVLWAALAVGALVAMPGARSTGVAETARGAASGLPAPALHVAPQKLTEGNAYFARVGSFFTEAAAMEHKRDLERASLGVSAAVFPPRRKGGYWTVVTASYASKEEALAHVRFARRNLQNDAFMWRAPSGKDGAPEKDYVVHPPSVALAAYPNLFAPPAPQGDTGEKRFVAVSAAADRTGAEGAAQGLRDRFPGLRVAVYPPVPGESPAFWRVVLAANATADPVVDEAVAISRRLGIAEDATVLRLAADAARTWRADDRVLIDKAERLRGSVLACYRKGNVTIGTIRACVGEWVTKEAFRACIGDTLKDDRWGGFVDPQACVSIPDGINAEPMIRKLREKLDERIVLKLDDFEKEIPSAATMVECRTQAKGDMTAFQACVVKKLGGEDRVKALGCLTAKSAEDAAKCLAGGADDPKVRKLAACAVDKGTSSDAVVGCALQDADFGVTPEHKEKLRKAEDCINRARSEGDLRGCIPDLVLDEKDRAWAECVRSAGTDLEKSRGCFDLKADVARAKRLTECAKSVDAAVAAACIAEVLPAEGDAARAAGCIASGKTSAMGFAECLAGDDAKRLVEAGDCLAGAGGPREAADKCAKVLLGGKANLAQCALDAFDGREISGACAGVAGSDAQRIVEAGKCLKGRKDEDKLGFVKCLADAQGDKRLGAALAAAGCAADAVKKSEGKANAVGALANCAGTQLGGTGGKVAACMASQDDDARDPLKCLGAVDPRLAGAQRAYECAKSAGDVGGMIESCGGGVLDDRSRRVAACLARAGGDKGKLAGCAAQGVLEGEAGRLAGCAASSQGATSFAICAAAPHVNEDWRIAAECATSSGGEPISAGICAGGRLAMRELLGCLKGKLGGPGCFGEGNTIRKFVENAWSDLTKGPGKNNEVVKFVDNAGRELKVAYDKAEKLVQDAGKVFEEGAKFIDKHASKAGKWFRKTFGDW